MPMVDVDAYEQEILTAFEQGQLKSVATKDELQKLKVVARVTAIKNRPVPPVLHPVEKSKSQ